MKFLITTILISLFTHLGFAHEGHDHAPITDEQAISQAMKKTWDRVEKPLTVNPIAVTGNFALADWFQDGRAGRAFLVKTAHGWKVKVCGGDHFKEATLLVHLGMTEIQAQLLLEKLNSAELNLSAEQISLIGEFKDLIHMEVDGHHGHGHH